MHAARQPKISVVIPVRNGAPFIEEALDSVLRQDYSHYEVLIIDDGSTDGYDYVSLASRDERVRVLFEPGRGVSCARNLGIRNACGELVAFLDADDAWCPGKLRAQADLLRCHPHIGAAYGPFVRWPSRADGSYPDASSLAPEYAGPVKTEPSRSGWIYTKLLGGLLLNTSTVVVRRDLCLRVGCFAEGMRVGEDYDLWLRLSRITEIHSLDRPLALYRVNPSSAMHRLDPENHMAQLLRIARDRWGLVGPDGSALSESAFRARLGAAEFDHGYWHYWRGDASVARASFARSLRDGKLSWRAGVYYLLSILRSVGRQPRA